MEENQHKYVIVSIHKPLEISFRIDANEMIRHCCYSNRCRTWGKCPYYFVSSLTVPGVLTRTLIRNKLL